METEEEGGSQDFLMKLRSSHLDDDELLEIFYNKVIDNYNYGENYLILLIDANYDVPGKASDEFDMMMRRNMYTSTSYAIYVP